MLRDPFLFALMYELLICRGVLLDRRHKDIHTLFPDSSLAAYTSMKSRQVIQHSRGGRERKLVVAIL